MYKNKVLISRTTIYGFENKILHQVINECLRGDVSSIRKSNRKKRAGDATCANSSGGRACANNSGDATYANNSGSRACSNSSGSSACANNYGDAACANFSCSSVECDGISTGNVPQGNVVMIVVVVASPAQLKSHPSPGCKRPKTTPTSFNQRSCFAKQRKPKISHLKPKPISQKKGNFEKLKSILLC